VIEDERRDRGRVEGKRAREKEKRGEGDRGSREGMRDGYSVVFNIKSDCNIISFY
jgi:hypothetical protein